MTPADSSIALPPDNASQPQQQQQQQQGDKGSSMHVSEARYELGRELKQVCHCYMRRDAAVEVCHCYVRQNAAVELRRFTLMCLPCQMTGASFPDVLHACRLVPLASTAAYWRHQTLTQQCCCGV